jgi:hypothetical protein
LKGIIRAVVRKGARQPFSLKRWTGKILFVLAFRFFQTQKSQLYAGFFASAPWQRGFTLFRTPLTAR